MWKREFLVLSLALLCLGLCSFGSCGSASAESKTEISPDTKVLIAYFSWSGNTRAAAEKIRDFTGGTLFEIQAKEPYPATYQECLARAKSECADGVRPELAATVADLAQYDMVFIGSPTWYGVLAPPVLTFLSNPALKGKSIVLFCTHGGGGSDSCFLQAEKVCRSIGVERPVCIAFPGSQVRHSDQVERWLERDFEIKK